MLDREKIMHGLESCTDDFPCEECSYCVEGDCIGTVMKDALALLREQEPVRWVKISPAGIYECSGCGQNVMTGDIEAYRYCHGCGRKVDWNA